MQFDCHKTLLLFSAMCPVLLGTNAQQYSYEWNEAPLAACIEEVERTTEFEFFYVKDWLDNKVVTGQVASTSIDEVLSLLFENGELHYLKTDQRVMISTFPVIQELNLSLIEQPYSVGRFTRESQERNGVVSIGRRREGLDEAILTGLVTDANQNPVSATLVYVNNLKLSAISDANGRFSLTLPVGEHDLSIQQVGFENYTQKIEINSDGELNLELVEKPLLLEEIEVVAGRADNVASNISGLTKIDLQQARTVPKILGEGDIVQIALALPGVQSVGEGASGFNVRGGKTDQNLVLFNQATIYNPFHFFGFFSAFNSDIIGESNLYKGSVPSTYGGRLSSILDVRMKKGEDDEFSGKVGISPATSSLGLNVPIIKEQTTLVAGARATYSDWITNLVDNETIKNSDPSFYDVALSINHRIKDKHLITASGYYSSDQFRLTPDSLFSYYNLGVSADWKYTISEKLDLNTTAAFSQYSFNIENESIPEERFQYGFSIEDLYLKTYGTYYWNDHAILAGVDVKEYNLNPGFIKPVSDISLIEGRGLQKEKAREASVFVSDDFPINSKLRATVGLRYSSFTACGPREINFYEDNQIRSDASLTQTVSYAEDEKINTYSGAEGRASFNYLVNPELSVKANFTMMRQYLHSLSNTVSVSPIDTWKLSDPNVLPQLSNQYSIGVFRNFNDNTLEASIELYYKDFDNILDYKVGADLVLNSALERDIIQGEGRSRGIELLLKKNSGKLTGWLGYTYSRSEQRFNSPFAVETINGGRYFPSNFDKPHDVSLVTNYKLDRRVSLSFNMIFTSGRPVTYPTARYTLSGTEVVHFGNRNEFRIPNYFRLDFGFNVEPSHKKNNLFYTYWSFSVYNLTSRNNVYSVFFRGRGDGEIQGYELSVLASAIPSITYNVVF